MSKSKFKPESHIVSLSSVFDCLWHVYDMFIICSHLLSSLRGQYGTGHYGGWWGLWAYSCRASPFPASCIAPSPFEWPRVFPLWPHADGPWHSRPPGCPQRCCYLPHTARGACWKRPRHAPAVELWWSYLVPWWNMTHDTGIQIYQWYSWKIECPVCRKCLDEATSPPINHALHELNLSSMPDEMARYWVIKDML